MTTVPGRIRWAVDLLDIHSDHRILEIGCGPGVAAGLVAERLTTGHLVAIDRSATAISRATARNTSHIDTGRLTLVNTDLAGYEHPGPPFDKIFAMNVNVFWTGPADREWAAIDRLLRPGGGLFLFYGYGTGDSATTGRDIEGSLQVRLTDLGYSTSSVSGPDNSGICLSGRR
jgi:SAM-dependent methyltransferase